MTENRPNVVWIVGAGFSRPLGGPLLDGLLTPGSFRDLQQRHGGSVLVANSAAWACHVYQYGRAFVDGGLARTDLRGEKLWGDAEVFIDLLDSTGSQSNARHTIERIVQRVVSAEREKPQWDLPTDGNGLKEMRLAARRLIAAECSDFATHAALGADHDDSVVPERWSAHVAWLKQLDNQHTIVTFNYDRAIERMGRHFKKKWQPNDGPVVLLPGESPEQKEFAGRAKVLKLHGSVDWWAPAHGGIERAKTFDFALTASEEHMVIATPGPTKTRVTEALEPLWALAEREIERANAVVFVGYRFPPTDAVARRRILGAIERRAKTTGGLALHVVLGPRSADAPRLVELLRFAAERGGLGNGGDRGPPSPGVYHVREHNLYSQDFFTVYREDLLNS